MHAVGDGLCQQNVCGHCRCDWGRKQQDVVVDLPPVVTVSKDRGFSLVNGPHVGPEDSSLGPILFSTVF